MLKCPVQLLASLPFVGIHPTNVLYFMEFKQKLHKLLEIYTTVIHKSVISQNIVFWGYLA